MANFLLHRERKARALHISSKLVKIRTNIRTNRCTHEYRRKAGNPRRRRKVRCGLHILRCGPRGAARPAGKRNGRRVLPQLHTRWALHLASEGAHDQRLHLRLRLLRESYKQRSRAHRVHPARAGRPDDIVLPTQLYRRAVRKLRRHKKPGLHDRAHDRDAAHPARRVRLSRVHPREGGARHLT